jgi:prefoldin subunit 5
MADDPIKPVIDALAVLATPNTPYATGTPTDKAVLNDVVLLLGFIYGASNDMKTVGNDISTALTNVANVVKALADNLTTIASTQTDITNAMGALQQALALAQSLAPSGGSTVLSSGSQLFQQIQALLSNVPDLATAANELMELYQLLSHFASKLKPA